MFDIFSINGSDRGTSGEVSWLVLTAVGVVCLFPAVIRLFLSNRGNREKNIFDTGWYNCLKSRHLYPLGLQVASSLSLLFLLASMVFCPPKITAPHIAVTLVWTVWWGILILLAMFTGRFWCSICPILFINIYSPLKGRRVNFPESNLPSIFLFAALGILSIVYFLDENTWMTFFILAGLAVSGILSNHLSGNYYFCRRVCPYLVFIKSFSGITFFRTFPIRRGAFQCSLPVFGNYRKPGDLDRYRNEKSSDIEGMCAMCDECSGVGLDVRHTKEKNGKINHPSAGSLYLLASYTVATSMLLSTRSVWFLLKAQGKNIFGIDEIVFASAVFLLIFATFYAWLRICGFFLRTADSGDGEFGSAAVHLTVPLLGAIFLILLLISINDNFNWIEAFVFQQSEVLLVGRNEIFVETMLNEPTLTASCIIIVLAGLIYSLSLAIKAGGVVKMRSRVLIALPALLTIFLLLLDREKVG